MNVKKFTVVKDGYSIDEVNKFLKIVTGEFEKLVEKNKELEQTISELDASLSTLEEKNSSVDLFKEELDSYIEKRKEQKKTLEIEVSILEEKVEDYKKALNTIFYDHMDLVNKIK